MKVYVHDRVSYTGRAVFAAIQAQGVEVVGDQKESAQLTTKDVSEELVKLAVDEQGEKQLGAASEPEQQDQDLQPGASALTAEPSETDSFVQEPNVLVYHLSAEDDSIQQALSALVKQKQSKSEQVFIAITTPLSWARTQLTPNSAISDSQPVQQSATSSSPDPPDASQHAPDNIEQVDGASAAVQSTAPASAAAVQMTSADADRRKAAACARSVLQAERTILAAANKDLKTYIVCPGILYGDGETDDGLHSVFRAAWEAQLDTPVPIYGSGHNILPTIHIADLAAYVAAVCIEPPVQQYLLAVDDAKLSQQEIVAAIADRMGNAPVKEQTLEELYFQQGIEHMLLNLPMTRTPLESPLELQYADGIVAHLDKVVKQYIEGRTLQPLRLMLIGPPAVGKSSLASRLAQLYQLQLVSVKTILAAADEIGGSTKQEVQAELSGKGGRVSDGTMVKLCNHVLSKKGMTSKGFVLEGWPKTPEQAEQLFTREQAYMAEERLRLEALRDGQAAAAGAAQPVVAKGKPAKPDHKGKAAAKPDLPKRHNPIAELFPTHVISLEALEPALLSRCLALGESEQAAARAAAAADGKPVPAAAGKGKSKEPAGPLTHNNDKDFKRRFAAYKASHDGDAASLKAAQAAEQLWWDDKRVLLEADAAAEAEAAAAASAKTLRLTALASMKSMGPGGLGATMGRGPSRHGSAFLTARSRNASLADLASSLPAESAGGSRKGTPVPPMPAAAALAAHLKQGVPQAQFGGLLGVFASHAVQVLVVDTNQPSSLEAVLSTVTSAVGPPHNYSTSQPAASPSQLAGVSRPATAPAAAGAAAEHAAAAPQPDGLTPEQEAEEVHVQRRRTEIVAMHAEPLKRCLMQQLMPVLAKAMVDATDQQAADPVQFIAQKLLEAGKLLDLQYTDPYAAQVYRAQQQKWDAKHQREAAKEALIAARAGIATT